MRRPQDFPSAMLSMYRLGDILFYQSLVCKSGKTRVRRRSHTKQFSTVRLILFSRLDALEREIREIRNSVKDPTKAASQQLPSGEGGSVNAMSGISDRLVLPLVTSPDVSNTITSKSLEGVEVGPAAIFNLFEE
jgi:hypothetical protein